MATNLDKPKNYEIWIGHPKGLRLRRHPRLSEALTYLEEFPIVIRGGQIIEPSTLPASQRPQLRVETLPVFRNSSVGLTVELRVEIDWPAPADANLRFTKLKLTAGDIELEEFLILRSGRKQFVTFPFPEFTDPIDLHLELEMRDEGTVETRVRLLPEKKWTWYVAFQTHLDLGWTDRAANVVASLKKMTSEDAVRICRQFADNDPGRRFVWTCECSEALRYAWDGCDVDRRKDLLWCVERGLIECCVLPFSFHSSIMSRDLMQRAIRRSFDLRREMGLENTLDLSVAQQNDVMGHSWVLPDLLAEANVRRAILGHNWLIRGCALPPLFRWRGPDGGEVLTLSTTCADYGGPAGLPERPDDLRSYSMNSPLGTAHAGTAIFKTVGYGENCGPAFADLEIDAVNRWQEQFVWPRIHIGGPKDYFNHIEQEVDVTSLPVVDKEISDWWVDGPASMPAAMGQYRRAMQVVPKAPEAPGLEDNLILFAEHTFGLNAQLVKVQAAANDWKIDQGFENYVGSWEDKEAYATAALAAAEAAKVPTLSPLPAAGRWDISSDDKGISRLVDPQGHVWVDASQTPDWPRFGTLVQRLLPTDSGSWFHHDLPYDAVNAGDRFSQVTEIRNGDGEITILQKLDTPAGVIPACGLRLKTSEAHPFLEGEFWIENKEATAQSELLALSFPLLVQAPLFAGDAGGRLLRVDADQLPDSNRDEHSFDKGWLVEDADYRLAVSSPDIYLWHFGGIRYCDFNRSARPRTGEVYGIISSNAWETNFRVWWGGNLRCRFLLRPLSVGENPFTVFDGLAQSW